jgi:hypothetical protein
MISVLLNLRKLGLDPACGLSYCTYNGIHTEQLILRSPRIKKIVT